jgi:hypothetical protein
MEGMVPGDVEAISTGKARDAYIMVRKCHNKGEDVEDEDLQ